MTGERAFSSNRKMAVRVEASAEVKGDRALEVRAANDRIAERAEQLRFHSRVPMMCECSNRDCRALFMISLDDYRAIDEAPEIVLTAPGHDADRTELLREIAEYDIRRSSPNPRKAPADSRNQAAS